MEEERSGDQQEGSQDAQDEDPYLVVHPNYVTD